MKNRIVVYSSLLTIPFEPGLAERYDNVLDCIHAQIYQNAMTLTAIAKGMRMTPSVLSRKLANNPNDTRRLTVLDLESYIKSTGDTAPIIYLAHKYCADPAIKKREALAALADLAPQIQELLKEARNP